MATNYRDSSGTDFDDLFDPYVQGSVPANTAFRTSDGTDLAGRYAPLSYGSKRADVNYRTSDGTDVSNLWAAKGTAAYVQAPPFGAYSCDSGGTHNTYVSFTLKLYTDGTWSIVLAATPGGVGGNGGFTDGSPLSGKWLITGTPVEYEIRVTANVHLSGIGDEGYTAGTGGWVNAASADMTFIAHMGNYINGGAETGFASTTGSYTVEIRRVGTGLIYTSVATFTLEVH